MLNYISREIQSYQRHKGAAIPMNKYLFKLGGRAVGVDYIQAVKLSLLYLLRVQ